MVKQPATSAPVKKKLPKSAASSSVSLEPIPEHSPQEIKKESNPFTDPDLRMRTYAWAGYALRVMLIVGACFSVFQYLTAKQERRVERTMQLVELWEQKDYQDAQQALKKRLVDLNAKYSSLLSDNPTSTELDIYNRRIGLEALTEAGGEQPIADFQRQFDRILYFLNRVSACSSSNICAPSMVDEYFRDFAQSFWGYFAGYIDHQRKAGSVTYAKPLEDYLGADAAPVTEARATSQKQ